MIPVAMVQLNKANAAFRKTASEQAVRRERAIARLCTIHFERLRWLLTHIYQVRNARLHAKRHLVLCDAGLDLRIAEGLLLEPIQLIDSVNRPFLEIAADPVGGAHVEYGITNGIEFDSLMFRGQEA